MYVYLQLPQVVADNDEDVECRSQLRIPGLHTALLTAYELLHKCVHGLNDWRADVLSQFL